MVDRATQAPIVQSISFGYEDVNESQALAWLSHPAPAAERL